MRATSRAAMVRPRPVPPYLRVVEVSSCSNAWKIFACFSGGMPMPVSVTAKRRRTSPSGAGSPAVSTSTTTSPRSVNLMALPTRLRSTWRSRPASPISASGTPGRCWQTSSSPFLCGAHGQRAQGGAQHGDEREIGRVQLQAAGLDLGEVQDVVDDPEEGVRRRLDRRQVLPLVLGEEGVEGQVGHAEDGVHGGADLVADVGQELVLGPVGRLRRLLGAAQLLLGPLAFGHVADEGGEQVLLAHADGGDADFGGELAAVAAQGRDLEDAVEQRPLAGRQEASQAALVSFAELRGDDGFGQDAADRLGPRPAEGDLGLVGSTR